jgi:hypothetical protein
VGRFSLYFEAKSAPTREIEELLRRRRDAGPFISHRAGASVGGRGQWLVELAGARAGETAKFEVETCDAKGLSG